MVYAYHVVTDRPMAPGQTIIFDENHRSGVYRRVMERLPLVHEIYAHPQMYPPQAIEHHTAVALREMAMEDVRRAAYPDYPSRLACLYASRTLREAESWADFFASLGRPVYGIVRLAAEGRCFIGDAERCFAGTPDKAENLRLAARYWEIPQTGAQPAVCEMLLDGKITVLESVREIRANLTES